MHGIRSFTGQMLPFFEFSHSHVNVQDTAHSLSQICRFNGHTRKFYSVAQHSVLVCELLAAWGESHAVQFAGLLHDNTENVLGDMTKPLKLIMPAYVELERKVETVYEEYYNTNFNMPVIKKADVYMRKVEQRDLMNGSEGPFPGYSEHSQIVPLPCEQAELLFLTRFLSMITKPITL